MKKICILVGYYPINRGGAEYQSYLISQQLRKDFDLFYISIGQDKETCFVEDGIKIYTLVTPRISVLGNAPFLLKQKIFNILSREQPDFIYQRVLYSATGIAAQFCQTNKCKLIWHIAHLLDVQKQTIRFNKSFPINLIERKYKEFGIKNCDYIIGQLQEQDAALYHNYGRKCDKIIYNFHPEKPRAIHKEDLIQVLWVANYREFKRPELFIDLAKEFEDYDNLKFVMVGRTTPSIQKKAKNIYNLEVVGEMETKKVYDLFSESHILVNTSRHEGFSNTFIQAWFHEVPVVSLSVDPDNLIKDKGLGFHSITYEQMVKDVSKLINDGELRSSIGCNARQVAEECFSLDNVNKLRELLI